MRTIELNLYSINELSEAAKQKAIEKYRGNMDYFMDFFNEYCNEQLTEAGFEETELRYSLSYSQGDGLSFSAKNYCKLYELFLEVLGKGKERTAKLLSENCTIKIKNEGRYCFASKSDIDLYIENYTSSINVLNTNNIDNIVSKVLSKLESIYIDLCTKLKNEGYEEIEYQTSEEAIIEIFEANEYTFEADGTMRNF